MALDMHGVFALCVDAAGWQARRYFERAVSRDENSMEAHLQYAMFLESQGDLPEALLHSQRAVDLDPENRTCLPVKRLFDLMGVLLQRLPLGIWPHCTIPV